jgi:hypothetical protein
MSSGIGNIHDFHYGNPLNLNTLLKTEVLYARYIYYIIILFLGLISVKAKKGII